MVSSVELQCESQSEEVDANDAASQPPGGELSHVSDAGSSADTESSVTIAVANGKLEEITSMMTTVENLKTIAAAWDVTIPAHKYSIGIKEEIGNFLLDTTLFFTWLEAMIWSDRYTDMATYADKLKELECRWATLKESVKFFTTDEDRAGEPRVAQGLDSDEDRAGEPRIAQVLDSDEERAGEPSAKRHRA